VDASRELKKKESNLSACTLLGKSKQVQNIRLLAFDLQQLGQAAHKQFQVSSVGQGRK
jgi:hypothetical protein